jgi:nitroimidazol reductase NimA-like FMN-containing flavoprotein (pyridoxamine 5'-phosphate oxidase superfamily)
MWIDARGSEVLDEPECRRLLAVAAERGRYARIGVSTEGAPVVVPVDFALDGRDIVVILGHGFIGRSVPDSLVAVEVDGIDDGTRAWSVLVRGFAERMPDGGQGLTGPRLPSPRVAEPGDVVVRIRSDVVTGRRFPPSSPGAHGP